MGVGWLLGWGWAVAGGGGWGRCGAEWGWLGGRRVWVVAVDGWGVWGEREGMVTVEDVARLVGELPGTGEIRRHGHRTWTVRDKAYAWERPFSKADLKRFGSEVPPAGAILAVKVEDLGEKEAVLAARADDGFFTISHFDGYAAVLIELERVSEEVLREALLDGWLVFAPEAVAQEVIAARKRSPKVR
ncbi:hypothetical protein GCM10009534_58690 [Kribbella sandramycini]